MQTVFTGNGTFVNGLSTALTAKSLLVGGGGGGGSRHGGGGGAGAVLYNATMSIPVGSNAVVVGTGGLAGSYEGAVNHGNGIGAGGNGGNTVFNGTTVYGGGGGKTYEGNTANPTAVGSGGGGGGNTNASGGGTARPAGTAGVAQSRNAGGAGPDNTNGNAGGGGGAGGAGSVASGNNGGAGGVGVNHSAVFGTTVGQSGWFGGGGGGGSRSAATCGNTGGTAGTGGVGGNGGGGRGGDRGNHTNGSAGLANTGGGGGGNRTCNTAANFTGFAGGSGVVILNYPAGVWSSSDLSVATVTQTGVVTATTSATGGLATITYSSVGGCPTSFIIEKIATPTITSTATNETCASSNNGSISAVNISGGLSKVRFIRVQQNRSDGDAWINLLDLAAYEVLTNTNVALNKTVASSNAPGFGTLLADFVDQNFTTMYHSSVTGSGEWVEVDLGAEYNLDRIRIWNRAGVLPGCCGSRSNDMRLILKNGSGTLIHSRNVDIYQGTDAASPEFNIIDLSWSDGATTLNRSGLDAGSYTLNYSDATGCGTVAHTKVIGTTNPNLPASVSIAANPSTNICPGTNVTFTATPTNGGTTPSYQWKVNGSNVGTNSTTFSSSTLANSDVVTCVLTSNATLCLTGSPATSNGITMSMAVPGSALAGSESATCAVNGTDWIRFYGASGNLIGAIDPNGRVGTMTMTSYTGSVGSMLDCDLPTAEQYRTAYMGRNFVVTTSGLTGSANVDVLFPFLTSELSALSAAAGTTVLPTSGTVSPANPNDNVTVRGDIGFTKYSNPGSEDGNPLNNCTGGTLTFLSQSGNGATPFGISNTQFVQVSTASFSEFYLHGAGGASPLPVKLTSFTASCISSDVFLKWTTESEVNSDKFVIERSRDLQIWSVVGDLQATGNSNQTIQYAFTDTDPISGTSYYRLRQVDLDGEEEIFGPISVDCENNSSTVKVYPNPTAHAFTLEIQSITDLKNTTVQLTNVMGKVISTKAIDLTAGTNLVYFQEIFESGTYLIRVLNATNEYETVKVVIKH